MLKLKSEFPFFAACPALLWQAVFLLVPLTTLCFISFYDPSYGSGFGAFTLRHYGSLFSYPYLKSIFNSCVLSGLTVIFCVLLSFPAAYHIAFRVKHYKTLALVLLMLPSWTNFIVRIYAWFFLLEKDGFLSNIFNALGIVEQPHLLGNFFAVTVGMVYCYFPFMIIPIYSSLVGIHRRLVEAAADLGASKVYTFRTVILPLALPGVYAGAILVFLSGIGEFAVQEILGGAKYSYWGNVVGDLFLDLHNFRAGAAFTLMGLFFALLIGLCAYIMIRSFGVLVAVKRRLALARHSNRVEEKW